MLSFENFRGMGHLLEASVSASKRRNMEHIQKMKPIEFIQLMRNIGKTGGILKDIPTSLKVDGLGARFGRDKNGRPFFEGSRTGPIFDTGAFSAYAKSKTDNVEIIARATHYDDMLDIIKKAGFMKAVPENAKVVAEIFYNPMAEEDDGSLKFVNVRYNRSKLGNTMTIVPFGVLLSDTGSNHPDAEKILADLYKQSSKDIKIVSAKLRMDAVNVTAMVKAASVFSDTSIALLKSRKRADKPAKDALIAVIQQMKDDFAEMLLTSDSIIGKDVLGDEIEGLVFELPVGEEGELAPFKSTTQKFKSELAAKKAAWQASKGK